jgi:alkanesulfonate monooxygenase SsuD/methylene tetrahydromethanopterin reductase-like flavin-dependent oxidoreductase (luciferase family)
MRFSVWPTPTVPFEETAAIVAACEERGWHAAYFADHFMPNAPDATPLRGDTLESLAVLSALAARTTTIRLGTLVAAATYRHPAVFAKAITALDRISGGRAIAGLGAGWQENEHASYGIRLGSITERIDRFDEYVAIVRSLLTEGTTTFEGSYFSLHDAPCDPGPVQSPLPILLGVSGRRRTMGIAARDAQVWNAWTTPELLAECNDVLDRHCEAIGRDPTTLVRTTQALVFLSTDEAWLASKRETPRSMVGTPAEMTEIVGRYEAAGCDELIVPCFTLGDRTRSLETLQLFDEEVAQHFAEASPAH